jgi:hypothetical protein
MTKLEMGFRNFEKNNPYWSSLTCLAVTVMGKEYGRMSIGQALKKLVAKDDYAKKDKEAIINNLVWITSLKNEGIAKKSPINTGVSEMKNTESGG